MNRGVEISSEMTLVMDLERYAEATVADYLKAAGKHGAGDLPLGYRPPEALHRIASTRRERLHPWSSR
jgi:hypothetical protein